MKWRKEELPFKVERSAAGSLSKQMTDGLREAIASDRYKAGDVLPTIVEWSKLLGVSIRVPEAAIAALVREGLVTAQKRIGCVVELSPSEKSRRFEWRIDEAADRGLFAEILRRYRREPGHRKGKRSEMPPIPEAKLTPEEERTEIALSFAGVLQAWRHEYALRRGARGEPTFKPVQMRAPSKAERVPRLVGDLLYRAKTTCSKEGERPAAAVDGFMGVKNYGYFECGVNGWWQADMGKVQDVSEITVIPYYRDAKRPYRFVVKTSVDGANWTLHIDKRGNNQPFGAAGLTEKFQNTPMRYIRVENAGGNTINKHLHLVEVLAK